MTKQPTVYLVEDDEAVRESLNWVLERQGLHVESFSSPAELLEAYDADQPGCLVLDLLLPGMTGIELRNKLVECGCRHPLVIITAHGRVDDATSAMRMGAVNFLQKPLDHRQLIDSVWEAIHRDTRQRRRDAERAVVEARLNTLTERQREVLDLVVSGMLTKQIARQLGVSVKTVEAHRSHITRKMQVDCVVQLVNLMADYRHGSPDALQRPHFAAGGVGTGSAARGSVK